MKRSEKSFDENLRVFAALWLYVFWLRLTTDLGAAFEKGSLLCNASHPFPSSPSPKSKR
jgi:hypothetical protein